MIRIFSEDDNSGVLIENQVTDKNVVVLFPMTRGKETNLFRWEKLITTVNISKVAALVLIDKTPGHQASDYFVQMEREILSNLFIIQRPRIEPTHDSQSLVRLKNGLWIIQMHDDDDWEGTLEIPEKTNENAVIRTNFSLVNNGVNINITDQNWPDCRSIFSLLPANVWNRFADLICEQGGHVAGSIDSSLHVAVSLIRPSIIDSKFRYFYDNRHWESRKRSKQHLVQLTKEDGWGQFATVEMSLVSRAIDGIASLIFFSDLYTEFDFKMQIEKWIQTTKPHPLRIYLSRIKILCLVLTKKILGVSSKQFLRNLRENCNNNIFYQKILVSTWEATKIEDFLKIVEALLKLQSLPKLQARFGFWDRQLKKKCT